MAQPAVGRGAAAANKHDPDRVRGRHRPGRPRLRRELGAPRRQHYRLQQLRPADASKWLGMLTQITPPVARVAVLYNPATAPFAGLMLRAIKDAAPSFAVAVRAAPVNDESEIEAMMPGSRARSAAG